MGIGTARNPGAQTKTATFTDDNNLVHELTFAGEAKHRGGAQTNVLIDDAHTLNPVAVRNYVKGMLTIDSLLTDQDLSWLSLMTNGRIRIEQLTGIVIVYQGCMFTGDEGLTQNMTTGRTDEIPIAFKTFVILPA